MEFGGSAKLWRRVLPAGPAVLAISTRHVVVIYVGISLSKDFVESESLTSVLILGTFFYSRPLSLRVNRVNGISLALVDAGNPFP